MSLPQSSPSGIPSTRVRPGDVIAEKYEVERVLAAGGMGVVIAAHHKQLKRRVALKFLLPELCEVEGIVARFLREAQAMTAIQNEHVARVLDVGTTADGSPYMVMEYLEGEDLGQTLDRRHRLPFGEAIDYVLQAMEALAEAHVNGFVHRDLKPSNLFVTHRPDGAALVKVLDFGISKVIAQKEEPANLTHTRGMLGSPLYMAPEQIRSSKSVDTRADIWTLGVILHELIAGKSPFENDTDNVASVLAAIMADDPAPLHSVQADVPKGLSEVILKCLARKRDDRYENVAEVALALAPFAPEESRVSIDRIRRTVSHHQRLSGAPDLSARTIPNGAATPQPSDWDALSPLSTTAAAPSSQPQRRPSTTPKEDADTTFGKYNLIAILGQGGMADVFLAVLGGPEGLGFSKLVVIKRLRPGLTSDRELVSMLVDEARIAARLNHPNVVQTHEVGVIDGEYYIAMEYLEGQPLNQILLRATEPSPMPLGFRLAVVRDLLAGLHYAHELADFDGGPLALVHRDVTPQNVFVTYEGQVKVVDFGIAKARGRATETQQGILKGKVRYMSPEQAGALPIDRRTDVFAVGVVLWELLTGTRMWTGLDDVAILQKLILDKIPSSPRAVNPEVPRALDAIVQKALARKKEDRYQTARELQIDLEAFMESDGLKSSHRDLGAWVADLFNDRRRQAKSLIEGQLSKLRSPGTSSLRMLKLRDSSDPASLSQPPKLERLDRDPVGGDGSIAPSSREARDVKDVKDAIPEERPSKLAVLARSDPGRTGTSDASVRPRSRWILPGGAALVVTTALLLGWLARSKNTPSTPPPVHAESSVTSSAPVVMTTPSTPSTPSTPPPPPSAAPSDAPIHVDLQSPLPGAEFAIDGEPKARSPVLVTKPRDHKPHRILATAPGHKPETHSVTFDNDIVWSPQLVSLHPERGGGTPPKGTSTPATAVAGATSAAPPPDAPLPAGSAPKKRELDPDNPYAKQAPPATP